MNAGTSDTISDLEDMFKIPFKPKVLIYSVNNQFFRGGNSLYKSHQVREKFAIDLTEEKEPLQEFPCAEKGCRAAFTNVRDYDVHFKSVHNLVCSQCKKNFPTYSMLDIHIREKHDSYHEAAKAKNLAKVSCLVEGCNCVYSSSDERNAHVLKDHDFPQNFKFQELGKGDMKSEPMEVSDEGGKVKSNLLNRARFKPYVTYNSCFGRGSVKTFSKKPNKKSSTVISMKELQDAL